MHRLFAVFCCLTAIVSSSALADETSKIVNDITQLNPISVQAVATPHTIAEIQKLVKENKGPISIGGGRYSMGGQIATDQTVFIDMRGMDKVVNFSPATKTITVQTGMTWHKLQSIIDPYNLSVQIMQSFANFTVGGSLSVNVHGRYLGKGPIIASVQSFKIVLADGRLVKASRQENRSIFDAAIGGYGALGVIVETTLSLTDNVKIERHTTVTDAKDYHSYFQKVIATDKSIVFFNGDLYPSDYTKVHTVLWRTTDKPLTDAARLEPVKTHYWLESLAFYLSTEIPYGDRLCQYVYNNWLRHEGEVIWRNHEASHDVGILEPLSRKYSTYVLQEYFVPVDRFDAFLPAMIRILQDARANVVNISIRHAKADHESLLSWAPQDEFAFVLYYKQGVSEMDQNHVRQWTRALIDAALSVDGHYYLPYQIYATSAQFHQAYPEAERFFSLKKKLDPSNKFRNKLWDAYYKP